MGGGAILPPLGRVHGGLVASGNMVFPILGIDGQGDHTAARNIPHLAIAV